MKNESPQQRLKREIAEVLRSMDYVSEHPALKKERLSREGRHLARIYQQLALAWEFLALRCRHWDGYRKDRAGQRFCRICGAVKVAKK